MICGPTHLEQVKSSKTLVMDFWMQENFDTSYHGTKI